MQTNREIAEEKTHKVDWREAGGAPLFGQVYQGSFGSINLVRRKQMVGDLVTLKTKVNEVLLHCWTVFAINRYLSLSQEQRPLIAN